MTKIDYFRDLSAILLCVFCLSSSSFASTGWKGFYVGGYAGGALGDQRTETDAGAVTTSAYFTTAADINSVNHTGTFNTDSPNLLAGVQAGHDWQYNQTVYGIILDFGVLPFKASNAASNSYVSNANTYTVNTTVKTDWFAALRGRVGYPTTLRWPSLVYFTGGVAEAQMKVNNAFSDTSPLAGRGSSTSTENAIGWTAGVGVELLSFKHASIELEYLYVDMPSVKTTSTVANAQGGFGIPAGSLNSAMSTTGQLHANLFKVGLNYRFDE